MQFGEELGLWLARRRYIGQFWRVASIIWIINCFASVAICFLVFAVLKPEAIREDWSSLLLTPIFIMSILTVPLVYFDFVLVRALMQSRDEMKDEARTDFLTGLQNRRGFEESVKDRIGQGCRQGMFMAIDLDHFKSVNDTHGHDVGNQLLAAIGATLIRSVRDGDLVGRLGGEELAVFMPGAEPAEGIGAAERLREAISATHVPVDDGRHSNPRYVAVTASVGLVDCATLDAGGDAYALADAALYDAKNAGRDQVALAVC